MRNYSQSIPYRHCFLSLMAVIGCLHLSSCKDNTSAEKVKSLEAELEQNNQLVTKTRQDMLRLESKLDASLRENGSLKEKGGQLEADLGARTKEVEELKKAFEAYKLKYKVSMKARVPGMHWDDLTVDGTTYRNVVFKEMTDTQLQFGHTDGMRKLNLSDLPEALRDFLGLNIVVAAEAPAGPKVATDRASRLASGRGAVDNAYDELNEIGRQIDFTTHQIIAQKEVIQENASPKSVKNAQTAINDLEKKIAKLKGKKATAEIRVHEARQMQSSLSSQ